MAMTLAIVLWTTNVYFVRKADDILLFTTWRMVLAIPVLAVTAALLRLQPARPARVDQERLGRDVRVGLVAAGAPGRPPPPPPMACPTSSTTDRSTSSRAQGSSLNGTQTAFAS